MLLLSLFTSEYAEVQRGQTHREKVRVSISHVEVVVKLHADPQGRSSDMHSSVLASRATRKQQSPWRLLLGLQMGCWLPVGSSLTFPALMSHQLC